MVQGAITSGFMWIFYLLMGNKLYYSEVLKLNTDIEYIFGAAVNAAKGEPVFKLN